MTDMRSAERYHSTRICLDPSWDVPVVLEGNRIIEARGWTLESL